LDQPITIKERPNAALLAAIQTLIANLAKALVDYEDDVLVEIVEEADKVRFVLRAKSSDVRKLIGGQGRVVRSLRTIVAAAAQKNKARFALEVPD